MPLGSRLRVSPPILGDTCSEDQRTACSRKRWIATKSCSRSRAPDQIVPRQAPRQASCRVRLIDVLIPQQSRNRQKAQVGMKMRGVTPAVSVAWRRKLFWKRGPRTPQEYISQASHKCYSWVTERNWRSDLCGSVDCLMRGSCAI